MFCRPEPQPGECSLLSRLARLSPLPPHSNAKRQLKAALAERDAQVQRTNELTQQLQDKKRQLFSAIQVGCGLLGRMAGLQPPHQCVAAGLLDSRQGLVLRRAYHACIGCPASQSLSHCSADACRTPPAGARVSAPAEPAAGGQVPRVPGRAAGRPLGVPAKFAVEQ